MSYKLFVRQNNSCFRIALPAQTLAAAVTVALVFPLKRYSALWAYRKSRKPIYTAEAADMCNRRSFTKGKFPANCRHNQQLIGCHIKTAAKFFEGYDCRRGPASGDVTEVSGAQVASLGSLLVAEFMYVA